MLQGQYRERDTEYLLIFVCGFRARSRRYYAKKMEQMTGTTGQNIVTQPGDRTGKRPRDMTPREYREHRRQLRKNSRTHETSEKKRMVRGKENMRKRLKRQDASKKETVHMGRNACCALVHDDMKVPVNENGVSSLQTDPLVLETVNGIRVETVDGILVEFLVDENVDTVQVDA